MKKLLFVFVFALSSFSAPPARACSCAPHGSDADETTKSDAVFEGRVTAITNTANQRTLAQFTVTSATKGVRAGAMVAIDGGGICGFPFERGKRYKVFANKDDKGVLGAGLCSATREIN